MSAATRRTCFTRVQTSTMWDSLSAGTARRSAYGSRKILVWRTDFDDHCRARACPRRPGLSIAQAENGAEINIAGWFSHCTMSKVRRRRHTSALQEKNQPFAEQKLSQRGKQKRKRAKRMKLEGNRLRFEIIEDFQQVDWETLESIHFISIER